LQALQKKTQEFKRPPLTSPDSYRGRFAPSPSGLLHFGSLIAALASFLDAKATIDSNGNQGKWLVRLEDIDPPREKNGASAAILTTLDAFGLHWDEPILYQSQQSTLYKQALSELDEQKISYYCQCTRSEIKKFGGIYQGHCRTLHWPEENSATRLINRYGLYKFNDIFQGNVCCNKHLAKEDFIIHRKDKLFAYQLAVVHDDIFQNITHVIRGSDLLESTARQLTLYATFNKKPPKFGHIPLAVTKQGFKLSKQNKAPAINNKTPQPALIAALQFLGQATEPHLIHENVDYIISWATKHWNREKVAKVTEINIDVNKHAQY
jgi:glutamyl-Q tRNA(Asp) synthetase